MCVLRVRQSESGWGCGGASATTTLTTFAKASGKKNAQHKFTYVTVDMADDRYVPDNNASNGE
jgi:hypothetical protein